MIYLRMLVGGAVASVFVLTAVSLTRKRISRSAHTRDCQPRIERLGLQYEATLRNTEQLAEAESEKYMKRHRDYFVRLAESEGYSTSRIEEMLVEIRDSIREAIQLDREAWYTKVYADRLNEIDAELAQVQYRYAELLAIQATDARKRMLQAEFPADVPFTKVHSMSNT